MGFFKQKDKCLIKIRFQIANQFGSFKPGEPCNMLLYDDYMKIESVDNSKFAKLKYDQVIGVTCGSELFDNEASAVGRTIAGGLLLGGVGAIAGAASAVKGKTRKTTLVVEYTSRNGDRSSLVFADNDTQSSSCDSTADILRKLCGIADDADRANQEFL